jgi:hypothetical protein
MVTTLLISEAKVRTFSDINNMVDTDLITNNIRLAQDYYVQQTIGTLLYNKLCDLVDSGDINSPTYSQYKKLLDDYVQDFLLYATYYETLESIFIRPRNNGLLTPQGGESSNSVDTTTYNMKRQSVSTKMAFYNNKLTEYIIEEEVYFPELNASNKLYDQNPDYADKYKNPFVFAGNIRTAEEFRRRGFRVYDSSRKQYPQ